MHPISTALFIVGYGLSLPIAFRLISVVGQQQRLAFAGHQIGVAIALLGWLLTGRVAITVIHGLWLIGARVWFHLAGRPAATS